MIVRIPINAGGVPLNYLVRAASIHLLGYSMFSSRLPSLVFSVAAAAGVFILARQMKLRFPLLAMVIFFSMPIQFRYALESRPYSQALAITIWATVVVLAQLKQPLISLAVAYGALALAGLYTQPYTIFVFIAHLLWLCLRCHERSDWRAILVTAIPIAVAGLAFLPWDLWVMRLWSHAAAAHIPYQVGAQSIPVLLHELVGGGYAGTIFILTLAAFGFLRANPAKLFWALYVFIPILLALLADRLFGYFFATRQVIAITAPLALLAALGAEHLWEKQKSFAVALCSLLLAAFVTGNFDFFQKPRENWQTASLILEQRAKQGACILFNPPQSADLYRFFVPDLNNFKCDSALPSSVLIANSPYAPAKPFRQTGFKWQRTLNPQGPKIDLYHRE